MQLESYQKRVPPHDWHIMTGGSGPVVLFLHGAGGSGESFEPVINNLSPKWRVIVPDLPGHGKTRLGGRRRSGLFPMAEDIATLLDAEDLKVDAIVGHSAGAAIGLAMDAICPPSGHILINPALASFDGLAGWAFPGLARTLRDLPFASTLLSSRLGRRDTISRLLRTNGMEPDESMIQRYQRLAMSPEHIAGTLAMMGEWKLRPLLDRLPKITTPVHIYAARNDPTVPYAVSARAEERLPYAQLTAVDGGHLVHESDPVLISSLIESSLESFGLSPPDLRGNRL